MTVQKQQIDQDQQDALNARAEKFSKDFANAHYEKGEAAKFILGLCDVFGLDRNHAVSLEHRVKKASGTGMEFADGFFSGLLLVEMKSSGKDLHEAYEQASRYVRQLTNPEEMPRYILVCDFQNFHLYDLEHGDKMAAEFRLADLRHHVNGTLSFMHGYERIFQQVQERINSRAAGVLSKLRDALKQARYPQADMQTLLVRILFCLFGDDTEIFGDTRPFAALVEKSNSDGDGLGDAINRMFKRLDTDKADRLDANTPFEALSKGEQTVYHFPHVNGSLFKADIAPANFTEYTRAALLDCCNTDWSLISPDIFGTMFQNIMHHDDEAIGSKSGKRRDFGAHYTSERNIRRAIDPLFLDALKSELKEAAALTQKAARTKALNALYARLPKINIFDPACGCGNFLVVAYRELRLIEMDLLAELHGGQAALFDAKTSLQVTVAQFHGIEIDPTSAEIATVALWLTDHQLNRRASERFGKTRPSIPLDKKANIVCANALRTDWQSVIAATRCDYIVGNPPFLGKSNQNNAQKEDMALIYAGVKGAGVLDYVTAWYVKAWAQIQINPAIKAAFVSTNSITQGEQVAILWQPLMSQGLHIHFAHRTFKWNNEGSGVAAVHCVIVGFGAEKPKKCAIWDYGDDISGDGKAIRAKRINPYLVDAPVVTLENRRKPLCQVSEMNYGSMANDGGHLLLNEEEYAAVTTNEPHIKKLILRYMGAEDLVNSQIRYCLWLKDAPIEALQKSPFIQARLKMVEQTRLASSNKAANEFAKTPELFFSERQPTSRYLAVPRTTSERRRFIPIGFLESTVIANTDLQIIPNATLYHFGMLCATMHNAWMRTTCGRLESRYRYSNTIVYNNYPWAQNVDAAQIKTIEAAAQGVLDARAKHQGKSLAWLYNTGTMPDNLIEAHAELDDAVDEAYGYEGANDDAPRVAFLFDLYVKLTTTENESKAESKAKKPKKA